MSLLRQQLVISGIITETESAKTFLLRTVDGSFIEYQAGQFLTFLFDTPFGEQRRNYSISSAAVIDEPLSITVKRVANGSFSRNLIDHAKPGDFLTTIGAGGRFVLPRGWDQPRQIFFLAAGSGITPVYSLIKTILFAGTHARAVLIYSNRSEPDTIFRNQLVRLQDDFPGRFKIVWLFSALPDHKLSRLSNTRLQELMQQHDEGLSNDSLFFLCGPHDYMRMISITLLTLGIPSDKVRKEEFVTIHPVPHQFPPDLDAYMIGVRIRGIRAEFHAGYPSTILDAGLKAGHELPFSCKTGRCGTCVARCTSGEVWMAQNEVLTSTDLSNRFILTCTGYPVGGPVELDFDNT